MGFTTTSTQTNTSCKNLWGFFPSYILHTHALRSYLLGGYLPRKKITKYDIFYIKINACILMHPINNYNFGESLKLPYYIYISFSPYTPNNQLFFTISNFFRYESPNLIHFFLTSHLISCTPFFLSSISIIFLIIFFFFLQKNTSFHPLAHALP